MNRQLLKHSFPETLKKALDKHRITNYKLMQTSGLDAGHVSRLVRGLRHPTADTVQKLALALARLGVSNDDISKVQSSAGFSSFDGTTEIPRSTTKPHSRPVRPNPPKTIVAELPEYTFDVENTPPPVTGILKAKRPKVVAKELNMGTPSKFFGKLGPPKEVSLVIEGFTES